MLDSLDFALESSAKVKFAIRNDQVRHSEDVKVEVNFVARETST